MKTTLLAVLCALVLCGCDTTDQGITGSQLQANLRTIKLGMTEDQIRALIGKPGNITSQVSGAGTIDIWTYSGRQFWTRGETIAAGVAEGSGGYVNAGSKVYTFTNGKLTLITDSR